ncbi:cytochrome P450 [Streptomyces sp. NPDC054796]
MTPVIHDNLPRVDELLDPRRNAPLWQQLEQVPSDLRTAGLGNTVLLLRHADGKAVLACRSFRQGLLAGLEAADGTPVEPCFVARRQRSLNQLDGPEHARQRRLAGPALRPVFADRLRPLMREVMHGLIDAVPPTGICDAVTSLSHPYTIPVICAALGVPASDTALFSRVADAWTRAFFDPAAVPEALDAHQAIDAYSARLIDERRARPGRDLISELLAQETAGDAWEPQTLIELLSALIVAGTDTTRVQLASIIEHLSHHSERWQALRDDPSQIPATVEEIIRLTPVASLLRRTAIADVDLGGLVIPEGTVVTLAIPVMNRDPDVFPDPDRIDLARPNAQAHLSFGGGAHFCLGNALGRAEIHEALAALTARITELTPARPAVWRPPHSLQGPARLPLHISRRRAD